MKKLNGFECTERWHDRIINSKTVQSRDWFRTRDVARELKVTCSATKTYCRLFNQLEILISELDDFGYIRYRLRSTNPEIFRKPWRKISNEELGIKQTRLGVPV